MSKLIRTVAYVRVNEKYVDKENNLTNQVTSLMLKISSDTSLSFSGVYADQIRINNTSSKEQGIKDLLRDAYNNKFDMIITNSIYNFAFTEKETFDYIKILRKLNIRIIFLKEDIDTADELSIKKLQMLENVNIQNSLDRMTDITEGFRRTIINNNQIGNEKKYGYNINKETNEWEINQEQAEVVKLIYKLYLEGIGSTTIQNILYDRNIKTSTGKDKWTCGQILFVLQNETYIGYLIFGKTSSILVDNKFKTVVNKNVKDKYLIRNHHKPIISEEDFYKVQKMIDFKRIQRNERQVVKVTHSCFSKRMRCGFCGCSMRVKGKDKEKYYRCDYKRVEGNNFCDKYKSVKVEVVKDIWLEALQRYQDEVEEINDIDVKNSLYYFNSMLNEIGLLEFNENVFSKLVQCVVVGDDESDNPYYIKFIINTSALENPWISKEDIKENNFIEFFKFDSKYKRDYKFYGNLLKNENVNYKVSFLVRKYENGIL